MCKFFLESKRCHPCFITWTWSKIILINECQMQKQLMNWIQASRIRAICNCAAQGSYITSSRCTPELLERLLNLAIVQQWQGMTNVNQHQRISAANIESRFWAPDGFISNIKISKNMLDCLKTRYALSFKLFQPAGHPHSTAMLGKCTTTNVTPIPTASWLQGLLGWTPKYIAQQFLYTMIV